MRLGTWQKEVLQGLYIDHPSNPLYSLKGKAKSYWGRYLSSLESMESKGLIRRVSGPQGGKAWVLTEKGKGAA